MESSKQIIGIEQNNAEKIVETNENVDLEKVQMEEMSSSAMNNKNASKEIGNPPKGKAKKRICKLIKIIKFGGWLPDVLDWIKRTELAQTALSYSTYTFNRYCWPKLHGKVKPHIVPKLNFSSELDDEDNERGILKKGNYWQRNYCSISIADINPPDYIIGFEQIDIGYIDDRALKFVQKILPVIKEVTLHFNGIFGDHPQNGPIHQLIELLPANTNKLKLSTYISELNGLNKFNQEFPGFIFSGLQSIDMRMSTYTEDEMNLIVKWLNTPREDGKTKMLEIWFQYPLFASTLIICIEEEFIRATESVNFIVQWNYAWVTEKDFKIENDVTKEMLELQRKGINNYFLVRQKINCETTQTVDDLEKQFEQKPNTLIWIH